MGLRAYTAATAFTGFEALNEVTAETRPGFPPRALVFWSNGAGNTSVAGAAGNLKRCVGFAINGAERCVIATEQHAALVGETDRSMRNDSACGMILAGTADPQAMDQRWGVNAWTDNGWDYICRVAGTLGIADWQRFLALGGQDIEEVAIGDFQAPTSAGTDSVVSLGWMPDFVMVIANGQTAFNAVSVHSVLSFGMASSADSDQQWTHCSWSQDSPATIVAKKYMKSGEILAISDGATAITFRASLKSFDEDGFTLDWLEVDGATQPQVSYLAIKGGLHRVGNFLTPNGAAAKATVSAPGFYPRAVTFVSAGAVESTADTPVANDHWYMGCSTSILNRYGCFTLSLDAQAAANCVVGKSDVGVLDIRNHLAASFAIQDREDLDTFNTDGFTTICDAPASPTGGWFSGYWAVGAEIDLTPPPLNTLDGLGFIYRGDTLRYIDAGNREWVGFLNQGHAGYGDTANIMIVQVSATTAVSVPVLVLTPAVSIPHGSTVGAAPYWVTW